MVAPPRPGDDSFEEYVQERDAILLSLRRRADLLTAALNRLEGVSCSRLDGALYAFPTITLPRKTASSLLLGSLWPDSA